MMDMQLIFIFVVFLLGLIFYLKKNPVEGLTNMESDRCPNLLIQKGSRFYLHNTKLATVPGVNPIVFDDISQYSDFLKWQNGVGINCPVLFLQHMNDAQGKDVYKIRPSVMEPQYGLPPAPSVFHNQPVSPLTDSNRNDGNYNTNSYPSYDAHGQHIGQLTPLDAMDDFEAISLNRTDNAMSPYFDPVVAQQHIDQGYYKDNEVSIRIA